MNPYKLYANTKFKTVPFYKMKEGAFVRIFSGGKNKFKRDSEAVYILHFDDADKEVVHLLNSKHESKHVFEARNAGLRARTRKK